jgi:integrase
MTTREWSPGSVSYRADRGRWRCRIRWRDVTDGTPGPWHEMAHVCAEGVRTERGARNELTTWRNSEIAEYEAGCARARADAERAERMARKARDAAFTVGKAVTQFVDSLEASESVEASTISGYRTTAKLLDRGDAPIGDVPFSALDPDAAQAWLNGLVADGLSSSTVGRAYRLANQVYRHEVATRKVAWNPFVAVKPPKRSAPQPNALGPEMAKRLADAIGAQPYPSPVMTAAALCLMAGLREGEAVALRWGDVTLTPDGGEMRIMRAVGQARGKCYFKAPKTPQSRRAVPISPQLSRILARRRAGMVGEREDAMTVALADGTTRRHECGAAEVAELYVCGDAAGGYLDPGSLGKRFSAYAEGAGLVGTRGRRPTIVDLRHSYASLAIAGGADVRSVAAVMGHSSPYLTLSTYADALPEGKRKAVAVVGEAVEAGAGELVEFPRAAGGDAR